jgi:Ni,Fe-hydrogenase III large subunit/Ni,Fe-hydrogenase III component G
MTSQIEIRDGLIRQLLSYGELLQSPVDDQLLVQVRAEAPLRHLAAFLAEEQYYLVTVVGNDERELEDRRFKIYYMFSHPAADLFVLVEYLLELGEEAYPSLYEHFPAVDPFERELRDMLGLRPAGVRQEVVEAGSWLHESYPDQLHPLRRERTGDDLRAQVASRFEDRSVDRAARRGPVREVAAPPAGGLVLPVGPIHAGIIEPGQFSFAISGEAIEDLQIRLGYTHRGIERLFQSQLRLLDGWWLAEQVSGDSSFAHSLAYCHAAETLTGARVPPAAELLRTLFLELERIHNHVADVAALAEDVALNRLSSELAVVREQLLRLNRRLTGHRYLRRINRPGGLALPAPVDATDLHTTLTSWLTSFHRLVGMMKGGAGFRERVIGTGILTRDEGLRLGVTGLTARACGIRRDSRRDHPPGWDGSAPVDPIDTPGAGAGSGAGQGQEARAGDVYARFLTRVDEVNESHRIVDELLSQWSSLPPGERMRLLDEPRVLPENNYTFAVGHAEGFRGDVVYWLMQDKMNGIYRCKVRDASMLNWPALRQSVLPRTVAGSRVETVLADFPVINKSFNLSYSGNDL